MQEKEIQYFMMKHAGKRRSILA